MLMFSLLVAFTLSEKPITWVWVRYSPFWEYLPLPYVFRDFAIFYRDYPTTFSSNSGWLVNFTIDDGPIQYISGANEGKANYGKISFSTEFSYPFNNYDNYLLIEFVVKNDDIDPHNISIHHAFDWLTLDFQGPFQKYQGDRGITITRNRLNLIYTIIARDGYGVTNVDDYWFNGIDGYLADYSGLDNHFSWYNKAIYPNETKKFGVLLGIGDLNLKNPPKITLKNPPRQNNMPNQEITVIVNVFEIDAGERVTLYYNFSGKTNEAGHLDSGNGNSDKDITIKVNLGSDVNRYPLEIWAEDAASLKSNVIDLDLLVNQRPQLTIINQVNTKYSKNMVVEIVGTIWDDTKAHISYQIDDHFAYDVDGDYVCNKSTKQFATAFRIKDRQISYDMHTIKFWATDEFGVKSDVKSFTFEYLQTNTPEIKINQSDVKILHFKEHVIIKGQIKDRDYDDQLSLYYLSPASSPIDSFQFIKTMNSNSGWMDFEIIYQVPYLDLGRHQVIFKVVDQRGSNSLYDYYNFDYAKLPTPSPQPSPQPPVIPSLPPGYNGPTDYSTTISYTKSSTTDINGDPSFVWVETDAIYPISTDVARRTPTPTDSKAYIVIPGYKKEETKVIDNIWPIIVGIVAGVVIVIILAAIIIYHEAKKKAHKFNSEGEIIPQSDDSEDEDLSSSKKYIFDGEERSEYGVII